MHKNLLKTSSCDLSKIILGTNDILLLKQEAIYLCGMTKAMLFAILSVLVFVVVLITVNEASPWARFAVPVCFILSLLSLWMKDRGFNSDVVASMMLIGNFGLMMYHGFGQLNLMG